MWSHWMWISAFQQYIATLIQAMKTRIFQKRDVIVCLTMWSLWMWITVLTAYC